ncbi:MAG: addiction module protein, partial [Candidatus Tectomicrobia bacterium]|nr:addiction module protein [Candidatus Tectomicrobia bacterium]
MLTPVRELFRQASTLDEHDRATLAGLLLESLEHEVDEDVESAWKEEIEQRLAELDAGSVERVSWE